MQLRFVPSESTGSYFEALQGYPAGLHRRRYRTSHAFEVRSQREYRILLRRATWIPYSAHGTPVAFYSDKHSVFRINRDAKGGPGMTQFGRALAELNIEILCANSSQARGRVERVNRTLQDRLVKELRLAEISDIATGNLFLPEFIKRFNEKFAILPANPHDLHRPLQISANRLKDILCHREQRYVGMQLTFRYRRKQMILEQTEIAKGLAGRYVEIYDFFEAPLEVRWQGHLLLYRAFHKEQRVSPAAVVENKRLGHALAVVKALREQGMHQRS